MRPLVAVTLSRIGSARHLANRANYARALHAAGADTLELMPGDRIPAHFDALCLTGGGDIEPKRYGQDPHETIADVDEARDAFELDLLERALAADQPVLGICRGFQLLNVHGGGQLVQHITGHTSLFAPVTDHVVTPAPGSRLAQAIGDGGVKVNSSHHQAVTDATLAPHLLVTARVGDVVEGLENPAYRWVVAVQWHPERTAEVDEAATKIFPAFVAAAMTPQPAS